MILYVTLWAEVYTSAASIIQIRGPSPHPLSPYPPIPTPTPLSRPPTPYPPCPALHACFFSLSAWISANPPP